MSFTDLRLPSRPIALSKDSISAPRGFIFGTLLLIALTAALLWWQAPGLLRDWKISQNPVTVQQSDVRNGECTTRRGIFTDCEATLVWTYKSQQFQSDVSIVFVDFHSGDYWVDVVVSGDDPSIATMSLGIEKLWNRIIVLGLFIALFLGLAGGLVVGAMRASRTRRAIGQPGRLELTPVTISNMQSRGGKDFVNYAEILPTGKNGRSANTTFPAGSDPLMVQNNAGHVVGVAVKHEAARLPILLDSQLERLELNAEERRAALESIRPATGPVDEQPAKKGPSVLRRLAVFLLLVIIVIGAAFAWWAYYATSGTNAFDTFGMMMNEIVPAPMNDWACEQLQARFQASTHAPSGCDW